MKIGTILPTIMVLVVLIGLGALSATRHVYHAVHVPMARITTTNVPDGKCHEDMPCWNWRTMGNHSRGVTFRVHHRKVYCIETAVHGDSYLNHCQFIVDDGVDRPN